MDKLRALEYFVAAARGQSFSAAARSHNVSVQAIAKLINALEHTLRVRLFERSAQGLSLTSSGAVYLESCASLLAQMAEADEQMKTAATRARVRLSLPSSR
jgi:LysR family transcriptional regulator, regulator for bpeEF and oprC